MIELLFALVALAVSVAAVWQQIRTGRRIAELERYYGIKR